MDNKLTFSISNAKNFIQDHEMSYIKEGIECAKEKLLSRQGEGNDFLGWIDLPVAYDKEEFERIKKAANKIQKDSDVLLVIGIGGSYLGARAAIDFLHSTFYNSIGKEERKTPEIYFCGNSMSGDYLNRIIKIIEGKDFSINVISKSGTTTESAIAFRVFKEILEKKYGKENGYGEYIKEAMAFIKNEYACGIGVQELAEHLNVNRSYLYTIFMNELHISPKDFLQKYRITRARELLVLTELSVESIGKSCGYGNAERFARAFKHEAGLTPTQFRRQDRSKNRRNLEVSEDGLEQLINS